jgi:hypothetical protein
MRITKTKAACYTPQVTAKEQETMPKNWSLANTNAFTTHGLGVGPYMWWGQTDKLITLDSPQKTVLIYLFFSFPANNS